MSHLLRKQAEVVEITTEQLQGNISSAIAHQSPVSTKLIVHLPQMALRVAAGA